MFIVSCPHLRDIYQNDALRLIIWHAAEQMETERKIFDKKLNILVK